MISANQLTDKLVKAGIPQIAIHLFDDDYELPDPDWIKHDLSKAFSKFLFDTGIVFNSEQYDCNKFAKSASTIADWCWAKTNKTEAALAFGLMGIPGHMLCVAAHIDGVKFYEPQPMGMNQTATLTESNLTKEGILECFTCIFV